MVPAALAFVVLVGAGWWFAGSWQREQTAPVTAAETAVVSQSTDNSTAAEVVDEPAEENVPEPGAAEIADADEATATEDVAVVSIVQENPVVRLRANRERWPRQVKLTAEVRFPAMSRGRKVGEVTVPAGAEVDLVAIEEGEVEVSFREGRRRLPHDSTNLAELAAAILSAPASAEKKTPVAAAEKPAPERPASDPSLLSAAQSIDGLIRAGLTKRKLTPPAVIDDERFLRRAYLTAVGRIPTAEEAAEFLGDHSAHKRTNLVSRLVRSSGYASQMTNWIFDLLRIVDRNNVAQIRFPVYRQWVRDAVAQNMPWDQMVTSLLTARGGGWDGETAAVGYFTRDRGMPLDNLAITMRVFLGDRMECAQCHNDPFGDTKQKDFFRLAAFTNGQDPVKQDLFRGIFQEMNARPQNSLEHQAAWMFWRDIYGNSLGGGGTGRIALPRDYSYKDARPGDILGARVPFGVSTTTTGQRDRDDGREKLAEWMTRGTGDRFPAMIANSMWRKVMGAGFFEPGDSYVEPTETHEPEVAARLAALMKQLKYNLRDYQEVLMLTQAFQAVPNPAPSAAAGGADDFTGRRVKRLAAEQVWDSLVTLASGNPDNEAPRPPDDRIFVEGRPVLEKSMNMTQLSREVLSIDNEKEMRAYFLKFVERLKETQDDTQPAMAMMNDDPVSVVRSSHARASELPSPAPPNHFLRLFGQSNREIVDGSTREPNMGQVLSLMNGFVQRELIAKPDARLNLDLAGAETPAEKIRRLYLAIFSREPTPEETGALGPEFEASPEGAPANIASAMIMSAEFLYLQ